MYTALITYAKYEYGPMRGVHMSTYEERKILFYNTVQSIFNKEVSEMLQRVKVNHNS